MADWQRTASPFISGVHRLGGSQNLAQFVPGSCRDLPADCAGVACKTAFLSPTFFFQNVSIVKIFTIAFSKYLYYNKRENSFFDYFIKNCPPADTVQTGGPNKRRSHRAGKGPAFSLSPKKLSPTAGTKKPPAICKTASGKQVQRRFSAKCPAAGVVCRSVKYSSGQK